MTAPDRNRAPEGTRPINPPNNSPHNTPHTPPYAGGSLRRLWTVFYAPYWPRLVLALVAMGVYAVSASLIPAGVEMINSAFGGETGRAAFEASRVIVWGPLLIIGLGAVNAAAQFAQARLSASAALGALKDIQTALARKLVGLDESQTRALGGGQAAALMINDATVLRETLTRASTAIRDLMTLIGLALVMIYYDWALFAVVLVVYPLIGWPVTTIGKRLRVKSGDAQAQAGEIAAYADDLVRGARAIRAYNQENAFAAAGEALFERRRRALDAMARLRAANEPFVFFVGSLALAIVVAVVALRIRAGALDVAEFISFIIALLLMSQPARGLSTLNAVAQEGLGALDRIFAVLDRAPTIVDVAGALPLGEAPGAIAFDGVSFAYGGEARALEDFSLHIAPGETVALVGESGAGKSTVFALLMRLYEPSAGVISLGDQDIRQFGLASLRARIALVDQDTALFRESVADNIARGRNGASRAAIEAAAAAAGARAFIDALPAGFDTVLAEGGAELSGGQRQRLAIARAFLKDAPILLLDEATSARDAETEAGVQSALKDLRAGRTTIAIAHRLATVRDADKIVFMKAGRVVDMGTHDELTARAPAYARLADLQFKERP